ncbi:High-affinity zinc uptake system protein ZnuA [invertebrate metagenome]|uniref:High-affinity zinc uptake system protein ZnuA n=1 Tax=invertebrate metagenome TaxID=1711999 RepID=A0A2H9T414_9ZZZZ
MQRVTLLALSLLMAFSGWVCASAKTTDTVSPPKVMASIKPLQLIAQAITDGVSDADVLLPPNVSPHGYSLKPSDIQQIKTSNVVFWIGPEMEASIAKVLGNEKNTTPVAMMEQPGITLLKSQKEHKHDKHAHHHGEYDPHIWLSPENAIAIAGIMTKTLISLDSSHLHQSHYQTNFHRFKIAVLTADKHNHKKIATLQNRPFFVFHDAYLYLENNYHLNVSDYFTLTPEQQPGAKHMLALQKKLQQAGTTCIFREPQFQPVYIDRIIGNLPVTIGVLDPLAGNIKVEALGYVHFLNDMVDTIYSCLNTQITK